MARKPVTVTVPGIPPSLNAWQNWHHFAKGQGKRDWKDKVAWCVKQTGEKPIAGRVRITLTYFFDSTRRRDFDNYSGKFLLDGLQPGLISNDCSEVVDSLTIRFGMDPHRPRVEILVEPL